MNKRLLNTVSVSSSVVAVLIITVILAACENDEPKIDNYLEIEATGIEIGNCDVATAKARIHTLIGYPDAEEPYWVEYELASVKFENGGFKMRLPATIPDEYLWTKSTFEGFTLSDSQAKIGTFSVDAYNSDGKCVGALGVQGEKWNIEYVYADRSFTEKGKLEYDANNKPYIFGAEFECSYKKGWNIIYSTAIEMIVTRTTEKPINEDFRWYFAELMVD